MTGLIERIGQCIPGSPSDKTVWDELEKLLGAAFFSGMRATQQNPIYHGEGDVLVHTQMVCRQLSENPAFHSLKTGQKTELFLAAVFHDIGKVKSTRIENGNPVSPHHASTGSMIVRKFLWKNCGICGSPDLMTFRETVCTLVRWHMLPVHLPDQAETERKIRTVAAIGELVPDFSWNLLCMLAEADVKGRIAEDISEGLMKVELSGLMAEDIGCLYRPNCFADSFTKHAYFSGRKVQPDQTLFDNTWGEVIMLSGLPGTGKDTWIRELHFDIPMISLDDIRTELRIDPGDNQGEIIQTAYERAREFLRKKQPFLWNATDLTKETRQKLVSLFEQYGASVRIVYLETNWENRMKQNCGRKDAVQESAVEKMLGKTVPPTPDEAQIVEWICV